MTEAQEIELHKIRRAKGEYFKEEIIEICLKEIKENGYVFLKEKFPKTNEDSLDMAVPDLIKSGELMTDPTPFQKKWVIRKNPDYKKKTIWRKYPIIEKIILLIIGAMIGLTVNLLPSKQATLKEYQQDKQQDSLIKDLNDSVKMLQSIFRK